MQTNKLDAIFPADTVPVDGILCAYRAIGQGTAVVLLHGIGSGAGSWQDTAVRLSAHHRVIAWDAPGYGVSASLPGDTPSAQDYADHLDGLLEQLNVQDVILVGHSLGAIVAAAYAARRSSVGVRQLILLSPALGYGNATEQRREQVRTRRLGVLRELGIDGMAQQRASAMVTMHASAEHIARVRWNMAQATDRGYTQAVHLLCNESLERYQLPAVMLNVLVGAEDTITPPEQSRALAERIGASFALIADAGHACHIEQGICLADMIESLITT